MLFGRYRIEFLANGPLYKSLHDAAHVTHRSIGAILEEAAWVWLERMIAKRGAKLFERLRYADALISEVMKNQRHIQVDDDNSECKAQFSH
jgi:hypothetical protein